MMKFLVAAAICITACGAKAQTDGMTFDLLSGVTGVVEGFGQAGPLLHGDTGSTSVAVVLFSHFFVGQDGAFRGAVVNGQLIAVYGGYSDGGEPYGGGTLAAESFSFSGASYVYSYQYTNFAHVPVSPLYSGYGTVVFAPVAAVPEPSSFVLAALGLVGVAYRRFKKRGFAPSPTDAHV